RKIEKRGRPLGSGNRNKTILGVRVTDEEFELIKKGLRKLKTEFKTNREIIIYLFKKYDNFEEKDNIEDNNPLLKLISEELKKNRYTKKEKIQLKRIYKEIINRGITNIFNI
ncbi:hypothetical protein, partial [Fusobacterium varium]|uniref:hypothetical protein n=1 Tax=Fusobacterium varium TaxID=856 RepID=UPI002FE4F666